MFAVYNWQSVNTIFFSHSEVKKWGLQCWTLTFARLPTASAFPVMASGFCASLAHMASN